MTQVDEIYATRNSPFLAFAFFLVMLMTGGLIVQTAGHLLDVPLARHAFFIALLPALWLAYGYGFGFSRRHIVAASLLALLLAALGLASAEWLDFTADGPGYQQPAAEAIMQGWNPFRGDSPMLWQNIYPSAAAQTEASLAFLYGSVEDTKMLQFWWLLASLPIFLAGLVHALGGLKPVQATLAVLCVLSATVMNQLLTHYVDSYTYLAGLAFIGGLLLYDGAARERRVAALIMTACLIFVVNIKLTGIYHAVMLSAAAALYLWIKTRAFPWKLCFLLGFTWLFALLVVGFRPYVTNTIDYDIWLHYFPSPDMPMEAFSGQQRPSSFDGLYGFSRFFYSLFSITGGAPHQPAELKLPWELRPLEWKFSGDPDARTGGFGPLFALGFLLSLAIFAAALFKRRPVDKPLAGLALVCLLFEAVFPQSWWARYVPFAYAVPFLLLLSLPAGTMRVGLYAVALVFAANSAMAFSAAYELFSRNQAHFLEVADSLKGKPAGSVYLVPPVANYEKYNGAYMSLERRLKLYGTEATVRTGAPCPHMAEMYSEFAICY